MHPTIIRRTGLALGVAVVAAALVSSPASATPGLFGSQDATYDGVYRQSLVIAGLRANHIAVPKSAVAWLNTQQCTDGGFEGFRADTARACSPGNPTSYSGEDTNATAAAAIAFGALGDRSRAQRALRFLLAAQNTDGGFPYYAGGSSDANSTAMALLALMHNGQGATAKKRGSAALAYLASATVGCDADVAQRGGVQYMPGTPAFVSDMATVQVLAALADASPWSVPVRMSLRAVSEPTLQCPGAIPTSRAALRDAISGYLARQLGANGNLIPNGWQPGPDITSTVWAVIGLAAADRAGGQASLADRAIRRAAGAYVLDDAGQPNAGRLGLLLLLVAARGESPRSFGGVNLVTSTLQSLSTH